jgi:hypothetical protein
MGFGCVAGFIMFFKRPIKRTQRNFTFYRKIHKDLINLVKDTHFLSSKNPKPSDSKKQLLRKIKQIF